jgi:hypothetical protein
VRLRLANVILAITVQAALAAALSWFIGHDEPFRRWPAW